MSDFVFKISEVFTGDTPDQRGGPAGAWKERGLPLPPDHPLASDAATHWPQNTQYFRSSLRMFRMNQNRE